MDKNNIEHTNLLALKSLSGEDMYGYQMITELERRSEQIFRMKEGTLYPILKRLENAGAVKSYMAEMSGRTRKYHYHITSSGLSLLKTEEARWAEYARGVDAVLGDAKHLA